MAACTADGGGYSLSLLTMLAANNCVQATPDCGFVLILTQVFVQVFVGLIGLGGWFVSLKEK